MIQYYPSEEEKAVKRFFCLCIILAGISHVLWSQNSQQMNAGVFVDPNGIMRWKSSNEEVSLFGVNYTTPFAHAFRAHKHLGLSLKNAIDLDVDQMARLGFDAFRVHVWDREISDSTGNLLQNEHLDLFDYLLAKLAEHNIKAIITPIAWWGNGWPEPDEIAPGFSLKYSRLELITNPKAREAGRNYINQFVRHKNPYTKTAYKDDPAIIAVEIINEPSHPENGQEVTDYINEMVGVLRTSGFQKPIFYNISQNWSDSQANAVANANIDGLSFQWYPTDLVHGKMLKGNYLRNVSRYPIPSEHIPGYKTKAKMVYEFDAADIGGAYMYPAMARSFREAGMQFATMFSYDPSQIAWANTEYPTHYMNLLYTPSKALSLMIAGKAFHKLPRMNSYGAYPVNNQFDKFRVDAREDLSEMNADDAFIYSNTTSSIPRNAAALQHIAGCGHSPVVQYDGTGAYFLDKLEDGVWKLEVYPDVLWLRDPFEATSLSRQVARLFWNERKINISLPDLGEKFIVLSPDDKFTHSISGEFPVRPGKYLIARNTFEKKALHKYFDRNKKFLDGLYTPRELTSDYSVVNKSKQTAGESDPAAFRFQIASEREIRNPTLYVRRFGWRGFAKFQLEHVGGFDYALLEPPKLMQTGNLEYGIAIESQGTIHTFPGGEQINPDHWDFSPSNLWNLMVVGKDEAVSVLNVARDKKDFIYPHFNEARRYSVELKNGSRSDEVALSFHITSLKEIGTPFGIQLNVRENLQPFTSPLDTYKTVVLKARSRQDSACVVGINFILQDGGCLTASAKLKNVWQEIEIPLTTFHQGRSLISPDSYPLFLPQTWEVHREIDTQQFMLSALEFIQIIMDPVPGVKESDFEIVSVTLKK
jgi:hypothetical protein